MWPMTIEPGLYSVHIPKEWYFIQIHRSRVKWRSVNLPFILYIHSFNVIMIIMIKLPWLQVTWLHNFLQWRCIMSIVHSHNSWYKCIVYTLHCVQCILYSDTVQCTLYTTKQYSRVYRNLVIFGWYRTWQILNVPKITKLQKKYFDVLLDLSNWSFTQF